MRRVKLIWFLAGVLAATFANLAANQINARPGEGTQRQYLIVSDRTDYPEGVPYPDREISEINPRILRDCGIQNFVVWESEGTPDGTGVFSGFQPSEQSDQSVTCVLAAVKDGRLFGEMKSVGHVNDLAPSVIQSKAQRAWKKNAQTH